MAKTAAVLATVCIVAVGCGGSSPNQDEAKRKVVTATPSPAPISERTKLGLGMTNRALRLPLLVHDYCFGLARTGKRNRAQRRLLSFSIEEMPVAAKFLKHDSDVKNAAQRALGDFVGADLPIKEASLGSGCDKPLERKLRAQMRAVGYLKR